jgi:uncharacterized protein YjbI with pentapeptide repeats
MLVDEAHDYKAVRAALDDAGGYVRNIWLSLVSLGTYLLVVVWSVTHKQLFLETPIKLPLVDVSIPLYGFFIAAPLFFLVVHAYLLLHLAMLADKAQRYDEVLEREPDGSIRHRFKELEREPDPAAQRALRRQLPSDILVWLLAAPRDERQTLLAWLITLIAWLSVVIGPLFLLLMTQWRFLPYQDAAATWWHRAIFVVDVVLLWVLWAPVVLSRGPMQVPEVREVVLPAIATPLLFTIPFVALTFPGEWLDRRPGVAQYHEWAQWELEPDQPLISGPIETSSYWTVKPRDVSHRTWLENNPQARRWVKGTLDLGELDVVEDEKLESIERRSAILYPWRGERTFRINGVRRLHFADLGSADLRRSDLRGAQLNYAYLVGAELDGALLRGIELTNSSLKSASLRGAFLFQAKLQGASLEAAKLQGAVLVYADLRGARLDAAQLQGAALDRAQLQGAVLDAAQLQGASLNRTRLQGASLDKAGLQGASLFETELQGASLEGAQLQGAGLDFVNLQGASLDNAQARSTSIIGPFVYGTSVPACEKCKVVSVIPDRITLERVAMPGTHLTPYLIVDLDDSIVTQWIEAGARHARDEQQKTAIRKRLISLLFGALETADIERTKTQWIKAQEQSLDDKTYKGELVASLRDLICSADAAKNAPYVARRLLYDEKGRLLATGEHIHEVASVMRMARVDPSKPGTGNPSACPGVRGFTDADWNKLDELSPPRAEPPAVPTSAQPPTPAPAPPRN